MYKLTTLSNGLRLITAPLRGTQTATILVVVGTGSKYETRENNGISHFLEHMFFKGTVKRPTTLALSSELDALGAEFNAFTSKEYTGYYVKTNASKITVALDIVSDMLLNSKLDTQEINRERGVILEEMNMYYDNPMLYIEDVFEDCLYGNTPAGWDTIGTKANILKLTRRDFISYLNSQYGVHNTFVTLAGNIRGQGPLKSVSRYFSSPKFNRRGQGFKDKEPVKEAQTKPQIKTVYKKTDQAHFSLGVRAFGYDHPDRAVLRLLAIILGGSMSSRLFIKLRERQGLAYYVRTNSEHYTDSGYLTTWAGVPVDKIDLAINTILAEYKKLTRVLVSKYELKRAKDMLSGRMAIQLEASDSVANWYARQAVMLETIKRSNKSLNIEKNLLTPEAQIKKINKITASDIRRVARAIFVNQGLNLAVIGPYKSIAKIKKLLEL